MKAIIPILFIVLSCSPDIEPQKPNETPVCLYGIRKPVFDDNGNLKPKEFITCSTKIDPYGFPEWAYFSWEEGCEECN